MTPFDTVTRAEGSRANLRITVPATIVKLLRETGMHFPGWVRLTVDGFAPIFAVARFPVSRPSVTITLPIWAFNLKPGVTVRATVEDATPYRARERQDATVMRDWLPFVEDTYFATEDPGDVLVLHSRHEEPFQLKRTPPASIWKLLGLYQAEGSKSDNAPDWTLANANPLLLASVPPMLEALGIPRERQYLEILRGADETPEAARRTFTDVGLRVAAERVRTGKGWHAGVLHVSKSQPLLRLFKRALAAIFAADWQWPSKAAARDYALSWLDGDGSVTIDRRSSNILLGLAGYEAEQRITICALEYGFGWALPSTAFSDPQGNTMRTLRLDQAADLAIADAFACSLGRARLLWALDQRLQSTPGNRSHTNMDQYNRARQLFDQHLQVEMALLQQHPLAKTGFNTGRKGISYPCKP